MKSKAYSQPGRCYLFGEDSFKAEFTYICKHTQWHKNPLVYNNKTNKQAERDEQESVWNEWAVRFQMDAITIHGMQILGEKKWYFALNWFDLSSNDC